MYMSLVHVSATLTQTNNPKYQNNSHMYIKCESVQTLIKHLMYITHPLLGKESLNEMKTFLSVIKINIHTL